MSWEIVLTGALLHYVIYLTCLCLSSSHMPLKFFQGTKKVEFFLIFSNIFGAEFVLYNNYFQPGEKPENPFIINGFIHVPLGLIK